jgi:hypothetical protein
MIRRGSASVYETPLRLSPASADNTKGVRTMLRQTKFAFLAALAVLLLYAYSEGYMGRLLCRNFKDTWLENSGFIACYRAP